MEKQYHCFKRNFTGEGRWQSRRILNSPPPSTPATHGGNCCMYCFSLWKLPDGWQNRSSTARWRSSTARCSKVTSKAQEVQSCHLPLVMKLLEWLLTKVRDITGEERPHNGHPWPWELALVRPVSIMSGFENQCGLTPEELEGCKKPSL